MLESLFNKVADLKAYNFIKKRLYRHFLLYVRLFVLYGDRQRNTDNRTNVAFYWNGERRKNTSRICHVLFFMETCKAIQKIDNYTFELKKIRFFIAKLQTKVQRSVWKEGNVVVMKLSPHKSSKHKQE